MDDSGLVRKAMAGDRKAFVRLVERYQAMTSAITLSILREATCSEDAAQDAFITAWKKLATLREPAQFRPWLAAIARNRALEKLRKRRVELPLEEEQFSAESAPGPDEILSHRDDLEFALRVIDSLPEKYRTPLILFYREDQSIKLVAESLGLSEDTVKQRLHRGRKALRENVEKSFASALLRSAPTTVFTASVAASLTALAPPAATAAAVSSQSLATSGTSAASTTTAMITSTKLSFLTAAFAGLACIPVGYGLGHVFQNNEPPPLAQNSQITTQSSESSLRSQTPPPSEVVDEWKRLCKQLGTGPEGMLTIYEHLQTLEEGFMRSALLATLLTEWAEVDPEGGFKYLKGFKKRDERSRLMQEWIRKDPYAAVAGVRKLGGKRWGDELDEHALVLAHRAPELLIENLADIPNYDSQVVAAYRLVAESHFLAFRDAALVLHEKGSSQPAMRVALEAWGEQAGPEAFSWACENLKEGEPRLLSLALVGWATTNPAKALQELPSFIQEIPLVNSSNHGSEITNAVVQAAAKADLDATLSWLASGQNVPTNIDDILWFQVAEKALSQNPSEFLDKLQTFELLEKFAPSVIKYTKLVSLESTKWPEIADWIEKNPQESSELGLINFLAVTLAASEPESLFKFVENLKDPESQAQAVKHAAKRLLGNSSLINAEHYALLHPEWSSEFYMAAFLNLFEPNGPNENPYPSSLWLDASEQISSGDLKSILPKIIRHSMSEDAQGTWEWFDQLPDERISGEEKVEVFGKGLEYFSHKNVHVAWEFLTNMNPGPYRDRGVQSLVSILFFQERPMENVWTALDFIQDNEVRSNTLTQLLEQDKNSRLLDSLETLTISEEEKEFYREILTSTKAQ